MASNFAARAAESADLVKFRSPGQWTRLGLAIQHPVTVYTARINQSTFEDGLAELTIDGGAGTLADVLAGMTVFIGSSAGALDRGIYRVRKAPTSTKLYINQTSETAFAENDYVTILDDFQLRQRAMTQSGGIVRMDYDIEFGDFRHPRLLPRIAPLVAVLHLADGVDNVVTFTPPSPTLSACYNGATVASYLYEAPGSATTTDMDTDVPSWTYDTAGEYRFSCTITDSNGGETVSYRRVFVDPASIPFKFEGAEGDPSSGNWSLTVTCLADVAKTQVRDRALCTLYGTDYYNSTTKGAVGRIAGYEDIYASGWVDGESITYDSESGEVTFTIQGPAFWLSKISAFPFELQDVSGSPTSWKEITEMDVDKAMAFLLVWTTTAPMVMDCFLTGSTTLEQIFTQPSSNLLEQINSIAEKVFASAKVNSYGQMYVEIDQQVMTSADRDSLPVVMDITKADRLDGLDIERNTGSKMAMLELSGWSYDGTYRSQVFSRAPGSIPKTLGDIDSADDYIIEDQDECNRISGCLLAVANNEFEPLEITLSANNRLFDIAPRMFATITILAADNPRGVAVTAARLIPRKVALVPDEDSSSVLTKVTFEFEAIGTDGVTYYPPIVEDENVQDNYILDDIGDFDADFPNAGLGSWFPDSVPAVSLDKYSPCSSYAHNAFSARWSKGLLLAGETAQCYFPCTLHGGTAPSIAFSRVSGTGGSIFAIKGGARVASADINGVFNLTAPLDVDGFEVEAGAGSDATYAPGELWATGTVQADDGVGAYIDVEVDQYYCLEALGGRWRYQGGGAYSDKYFYNFMPYPGGDPFVGIGFNELTGTFGMALPTGWLRTEQVSQYYGRSYYYAVGPILVFCVSDFQFYDNDGYLDYIVRKAIVHVGETILYSCIIENVCPPEEA
jgi:hypothetical protein